MSKIKDGIIGHAVGDAMGVPVEFYKREELLKHPVTQMLGYGSHAVPKGSWSDDTTMEICLIQSFIDKETFDYDDIMNNFIKWIEEGDFTATGKLFDIGRTCLRSIRNYAEGKTKAEESGLDTVDSNGNGSLMRILPVAYYCYYRNFKENEIYHLVKNISSLTHRHEISILGCYIYINYVIQLLEGKDKFTSYHFIKLMDYSMFSNESLNVYDRILQGDIWKHNIDEINSSGYIVDTLEASLWVLLNAKDYTESIIGAINLGGDTDTIGAITGSMAGILYGYESIPEQWLNQLLKKDYLEDLCVRFEEIIKK